MDENYKEIVDHVVGGITRGAFDYNNFDNFIEDKLVDVIPKFIRDEDNKQIINNEFVKVKNKIHEAVNNNWKVKKHNENIDIIRNLHLGSKEYYDFYEHFYDEE
jgi:hypothetical protein